MGAVILSPGITPFNPGEKPEYGYGVMENVVTSMDFERLLSSTGPYEGKVLRASDKKHPKNIAWIQCVGSRRVTEG
ncbi:MAG: disulfide reductase, partial [Desulfobacterales bacterium]|nr:disulfide reductase [Desulfobacterales bacterium]